MEYIPFPAVLICGYNDMHEYGQATLAPEGASVDFAGEYIPLLPLGADASIRWMVGDRVILEFSGKVYLSTAGMVRLVDVAPALLEMARPVFAANTRLPALAGLPAQRAKPLPVQVLYLAQTKLTLLAQDPALTEAETLTLDIEVDFLTICGMALQVQHHVLLRRHEALLLCRILPGSQENLIALSAYTARLETLDGGKPYRGSGKGG